ncbi:hypothetical protein [Streptomyces sp. NPDC051576]|uniref:hypothetical protein n=1 Tax=Streptomyces sp. NPDC051576 TaxID=3155803 RepID=UPI00343AF435
MKIVEIAGRRYRLFRVASIHEDADYVECRSMDSGECVCEIRVDAPDELYLLPMSIEADANVVLEAIAYAKEMAQLSSGTANSS